MGSHTVSIKIQKRYPLRTSCALGRDWYRPMLRNLVQSLVRNTALAYKELWTYIVTLFYFGTKVPFKSSY